MKSIYEIILEEIEEATRQEDAPIYCGDMEVDGYVRKSVIEDIIRKRMNDRWISTNEKPKNNYITVLAVDKNDYYFTAVYDKDHGFRSNDIGADVNNIAVYRLFDLYRPEEKEVE